MIDVKATRTMHANRTSLAAKVVRRLLLALLLLVPALGMAAEQKTFATPEVAVEALAAAVKADDDAALLAIFGEQHKSLVVTPDRAANSASRAKISAEMQILSLLEEAGPDRRVLVLGDQAWPFPIPLVREKGVWRFATELGADEVVNRRIGANERAAIDVLHAYLDAQRQYASRDRNGDGVLEYARKLASSPGQQDGLFWPADVDKGEEASPFGPLIAASEPYLKGHKVGDSFRGYHFRILTRQGKNAPGGAYNYLINGRMLAGFAMIAYPAEYGRSGVMSFMISNDGILYQKNLGPRTLEAASTLKAFDPDKSWKKVEDTF